MGFPALLPPSPGGGAGPRVACRQRELDLRGGGGGGSLAGCSEEEEEVGDGSILPAAASPSPGQGWGGLGEGGHVQLGPPLFFSPSFVSPPTHTPSWGAAAHPPPPPQAFIFRGWWVPDSRINPHPCGGAMLQPPQKKKKFPYYFYPPLPSLRLPQRVGCGEGGGGWGCWGGGGAAWGGPPPPQHTVMGGALRDPSALPPFPWGAKSCWDAQDLAIS